MRGFSFFIVLCLMVVAAAVAAGRPSLISLESRETDTADYFAIQVDNELKHKKVFMLYNPRRLVLDLARTDYDDVTLPSDEDFESSVVSDVRFGVFNASTTRLVFDLKRPISSANLHHFEAKEGKPYHLMLEMAKPDKDDNLAVYKSEKKSVIPLASEESTIVEKTDNENDKDNKSKILPKPKLKPAYVGSVPPEVSMQKAIARQWKGKKPIVMIDAGHGGKDPGASGGTGQYEKDLTLAYAKYLADALNKTGNYKALMTRKTDDFIYLKERVNIAREAEADIFISLHADAAGASSASGVSVYTVSEKASDREAAALAAQENAADDIAGVMLHDDEDVADILIDLAQRDTKNKSSRLADTMVAKFKSQEMKLLSYPHRYAGFRVLKAHDIPSVLIEMGFLTNESDQKLLKTTRYKSQLSRAIISALNDYFGK